MLRPLEPPEPLRLEAERSRDPVLGLVPVLGRDPPPVLGRLPALGRDPPVLGRVPVLGLDPPGRAPLCEPRPLSDFHDPPPWFTLDRLLMLVLRVFLLTLMFTFRFTLMLP